jgi:predicted small secreted protein
MKRAAVVALLVALSLAACGSNDMGRSTGG